MRLAHFYTAPYTKQALDSYHSTVPTGWSLSHKLYLYNQAKTAFAAKGNKPESQEAFSHIYESLRSGWQVFRNAAGPCWSAEETFQVLTNECELCSRSSSLTSANLINSASNHKVEACLTSIGKIKPTLRYPTVYPWMAVSKFLHFFNPSLFPIYDTAFMWNKVANGVFKQDYQDFCQRHGFHPKEDLQRFNLQYTLWASEIMSNADEECMVTFSQWFASKVDPRADAENVLKDVNQYYASAFEMIAIGAAHRSDIR